MAQQIKERAPHIKLAVGGSNVHKDWFDHRGIYDYVVAGEGEAAILQILDDVEEGVEHDEHPVIMKQSVKERININGMPHEILPAWDFFKSNAESITDAFNPVYDLFAGYVLSGVIQGENRVSHSPQEFLKNVVREF